MAPTKSLRPVIDSKVAGAPNPVRVCSDATGAGGLASLTLSSVPDHPPPLQLANQAEDQFRSLAAPASESYIFELPAKVATVFDPRKGRSGRNIIIFVGDEAACAAFAKCATKS